MATQLPNIRLDWEFEPTENALKIVVLHTEEREAPGVQLKCRPSASLEPDYGPTLQLIFDAFMRETAHGKLSTQITYRDRWKKIAPAFGHLPAAKLDVHELATFRSELASKYAPRTVNNVMGLLKNLLRFAIERGMAASNPATSVRSVREETPEIDPFTRDELKRIFERLRPCYRFYYQTALWTGARPCELQALRWRDVDLSAGTMSINKARVRGLEGTPKTKQSRRVIQLFAPALEALANQFELTGSDAHNYVFTTRKGLPITKHMDDIWKRACRRAQVRHRPPYQLRHTFASMLLAAGESPAYIARLLGHTTTETLFRHYARWIPAGTDGEKFRKMLAEPPPSV